jgi:hypothetical protein
MTTRFIAAPEAVAMRGLAVSPGRTGPLESQFMQYTVCVGNEEGGDAVRTGNIKSSE